MIKKKTNNIRFKIVFNFQSVYFDIVLTFVTASDCAFVLTYFKISDEFFTEKSIC